MPSRFVSNVDVGACQHGPCQPVFFFARACCSIILLLPVCLLLLLQAGAAVARG